MAALPPGHHESNNDRGVKGRQASGRETEKERERTNEWQWKWNRVRVRQKIERKYVVYQEKVRDG